MSFYYIKDVLHGQNIGGSSWPMLDIWHKETNRTWWIPSGNIWIVFCQSDTFQMVLYIMKFYIVDNFTEFPLFTSILNIINNFQRVNDNMVMMW